MRSDGGAVGKGNLAEPWNWVWVWKEVKPGVCRAWDHHGASKHAHVLAPGGRVWSPSGAALGGASQSLGVSTPP